MFSLILCRFHKGFRRPFFAAPLPGPTQLSEKTHVRLVQFSAFRPFPLHEVMSESRRSCPELCTKPGRNPGAELHETRSELSGRSGCRLPADRKTHVRLVQIFRLSAPYGGSISDIFSLLFSVRVFFGQNPGIGANYVVFFAFLALFFTVFYGILMDKKSVSQIALRLPSRGRFPRESITVWRPSCRRFGSRSPPDPVASLIAGLAALVTSGPHRTRLPSLRPLIPTRPRSELNRRLGGPGGFRSSPRSVAVASAPDIFQILQRI